MHKGNGHEIEMDSDQLYFYLVCFVMLITVIVGIINLVQGIDLFCPCPAGYYARKEIISELYPAPPACRVLIGTGSEQEFRQVRRKSKPPQRSPLAAGSSSAP